MRNEFECPVCRSNKWELIRRYRYGKHDTQRSDGGPLDDYLKLRRRVLFEVWFPDSDEIVLESLLCPRCGFMSFSPRPSAEDIDNKYRFLQVEEKDIGGQRSDRSAQARDRSRAERVFDTVSRFARDDRLRVLDVGGGNGKILLPFIEHGHECSLVDYNVKPIDGVKKIADRLEDVPEESAYDVVICSHVIEHLAEPAAAVKKMSALLNDDGVVYGEVPLGVWGGIGIENDPVTHVNFFTEDSFKALFSTCDMTIREGRQSVGIYNRRIHVIYVVAAAGAAVRTEFEGGADRTRRLINPSFAMKLARVIRLRHR
jgi:SAM-dependent methyltransferase